MLDSARKLEESKRWKKALDAYEKLAAKYPSTPSGQAARKRADEMKADEAIMAKVVEERAEKDCTKWLSLARSFMNNNLPDQAREQLEKVIANYPGTSYAATAKKLLAELR